MKHYILLPVQDIKTFHNQLKALYPNFLGLDVADGVVIAEFSVLMSQAEIDELQAIVPMQPPEIFHPISPRQFRQALIASNIDIILIENAINALAEPQKTVARIDWEYSTHYERDWPLVNQLATAIGFTSAQVDDVWRLAYTL